MKLRLLLLFVFCCLSLQNFAQSSVKSKRPATKKVVKTKSDLKQIKDTLIVYHAGDTLLSSIKADSYQWLNCIANAGAIPGATGRWFLPLVSGSYAVQITSKRKEKTSVCVEVSIALDVADQIPGLKIYPNPSIGIFMITVPVEIVGHNYDLLNSMGEIIVQGKIARQFRVNLLGYPDGKYYLRMENHKFGLVKSQK